MWFFDILFGKSSFGRRVITLQTREKISRDWESINILLSQRSPSALKQALITADKSLDNALRDMVEGETMAERLKNGKNYFTSDNYQKIWDAHKLRNNTVHESGYEPPSFMLTEGVNNLRKGLEALGLKV